MFKGGKNKQVLLAENEGLKRELSFRQSQIDDLIKQREELQKQIVVLHKSLIAKESPRAYSDMMADEAARAESPLVAQQRERMIREQKITDRHLSDLEGPLFDDVDDMQSSLLQMIGPPEVESLHGDDES